MNAIKRRLLEELSREFAADVDAVSIQQIGSSVFRPDARDIDVLMIDTIGDGAPSSEALTQLRACISHGTPALGAFDASSAAIKSRVLRVVRSLPLDGTTVVKVGFVMGPAEGELNLGPTELHLHVCGAFTRGDMQECGKLLPYHVLGFLQQNKCLLGPALSELCHLPRPDISELHFWVDCMHRLAKTATQPESKRKFIGRMVLCHHLHNRHEAAYEATTDFLRELGIDTSAPLDALDDLADDVRLRLL